MRTLLLFCLAASFVGCTRGGEKPGGGQAAAALNLADVAGKWSMQNLAADKDTVLNTYEINAAATPEGWTMVFPGRDPIPLHVMPGGDSIVVHAGPYPSTLRPGVQVTVESTIHLVNGQVQGTAVAHYQGAGPDSVLKLRMRGTRAPSNP